jgi:ferritin-like metal-binding protein YciE
MSDLSVRESKLVQYLNEAYGKEKELETALVAHIGMTTRDVYRKRLREHLTETKRHARELERRVKQLGGAPQTVPIEGFDPLAKGAAAAVGLAGRAAAAAQGPLHAIRGTGEQEKMLKNAKSEYADEHEEIATYTAIETLAEAVGDIDTAKLARAIRREEERMARFLERLIPALTKAVVQDEVPAAERRSSRSTTKRRRTSAAKRSSSGTAKRSGSGAAKRSGTASAKRSGTAAAKRSSDAKRTRSKGTSRGGTRASRSAA